MRVKLINMPFASLMAPSIALTQLKTVLQGSLGGDIDVNVHYLSLDFADYLKDLELYNHPHSAAGFMTGAGDWFFRRAAFPWAEDNAVEYLARYYYDQDPGTQKLKSFLLNERDGVSSFLDRMIDKYCLLDADVVGFTLLFFQTAASIAMARRIKERKPEILTVLGGACCEGTAGQELARRLDCVDYVFSGPALVSFPEFMRNRISGSFNECEQIDGVFSKLNEPEWQVPGKEGGSIGIIGQDLDINECVELDYEPFLDACAEFFPGGELKPVLLFETSRGCWWGERQSCSFCGLNGVQMCCREMDPEKAVGYIESMYRYYPRSAFFIAVDNIMPRGYVQDVFSKIKLPEGVGIRYEVRPDLNNEDIDTLCKAGVMMVQPGVESLSSPTLKLMRKGSTAFRNIRFLKDCSRHPVTVDWNLLIFSPGEDEKTYEKYLRDIPLLTHLPPPTAVYPIMFARYSRYFENQDEFGLRLRPQEFYGLIYPFDADSVEKLAYHFVDDNADLVSVDRWLDRLNEQIDYWRTRWFNSDGGVQARLCFLDGDDIVYDSRNGNVVEHRLSGLGWKLLSFLQMQKSLQEMMLEFVDEKRPDIEQEIRGLQEKGLVFEEEEKYLSLVL